MVDPLGNIPADDRGLQVTREHMISVRIDSQTPLSLRDGGQGMQHSANGSFRYDLIAISVKDERWHSDPS